MASCEGGTDYGLCERYAVIAAAASCAEGHQRTGLLCAQHLIDAVVSETSGEQIICRECAEEGAAVPVSGWTFDRLPLAWKASA